MLPRTEDDIRREAGFYWIAGNEFSPPEIAKWDGMNWWTAGADQPIQIGPVDVLSDRLSPPSP